MFATPVKATRTARRRGRLAVTALSFVAAASVALAPAASAAPGQTSSDGLSCAGLVLCGPFAASAFPGGPATNTLVSASVVGLITTGVINTTANAGGASASVANVSAPLAVLATLAATAVSSQCLVNATTGVVSGSASIVGGQVAIVGAPAITLATAPAPNTTVSVPGIATITLNRQVTDADGTLHVDSIFVALLGGRLGQSITIASSVCGPRVLPIPVVAPAVALGGGLAAALAVPVLGAAWYRRRQLSLAGARA